MKRRSYEAVTASVNWFAEEMKHKLKENEYKEDWSSSSFVELYNRLQEEVRELVNELYKSELIKTPALLSKNDGNEIDEMAKEALIIMECADVANFAMMIADNVRNAKKV